MHLNAIEFNCKIKYMRVEIICARIQLLKYIYKDKMFTLYPK